MDARATQRTCAPTGRSATVRAMNPVDVEVLGGGWFRFLTGRPGEVITARCARDEETSRLVIRSLLIESETRVTAGLLRDVPVARLEAMLNSATEASAEFRDDLREADSVLVLQRLSSPLLERLRAGSSPPPADAPKSVVILGQGPSSVITAGRSDRPPLSRPEGVERDEFYRRVADAYVDLVRSTGKPAVAMAQEAGVPVATARRWIYEARRRGALPAGQRGRAT